MLKTLRQNTKIILWILALSFVGWLVLDYAANIGARRWGRKSGEIQLPSYLGKINGREITYSEFEKRLREAYIQEKNAAGKEPDFKNLIDRTWNNLVASAILRDEIRKRDIKVSDRELAAFVRENPPPFVQGYKIFQTDGKFDIEKYKAFLDNPETFSDPLNRQFVLAIEDYSRSVLPYRKLQDIVLSSVRVTDAEAKEHFAERNEKVKVRYAYINFDALPDSLISVSEEEVRAYYREHPDDFKKPPKVSLKYIAIPKVPSAADSAKLRMRLDEIISELKSGADFAELAKEYSDDPGSADKGGDLGYFTRGTMVKAFEDAAFKLKVGEISAPVKTDFGWHIIKLEDRRRREGKEEIRARHILLKDEPSRETLDLLEQKADTLLQKLRKGAKIEELAAADTTLRVGDTGFFGKGSFIPGIGRVSESMVKFIFEKKPGYVMPRPYQTEDEIYVMQISERKKGGVAPFEEVKERARMITLREKKKALAREKLERVYAKVKGGAPLRKAAEAESVEVKETDLFSRIDYIPGVGSRNEFVGAAFALSDVGQVSPPVETTRGVYLIELLEKVPLDKNAFEKEKDSIKRSILERKRSETYNVWFSNLMKRAKIEDYRYLFYNY